MIKLKKLIIALFLVTVLILVNKKETKVLIPKDAQLILNPDPILSELVLTSRIALNA